MGAHAAHPPGPNARVMQVLGDDWTPEIWLETALRDMEAAGWKAESPVYQDVDKMLTMCKLFVQDKVCPLDIDLAAV